MSNKLARKRLRVVVDLTPMLPGGANGEIKPQAESFSRRISRSWYIEDEAASRNRGRYRNAQGVQEVPDSRCSHGRLLRGVAW